MDYLTRKELEILKGELESNDAMMEAEKYSFGRKLQGEMGKQMLEELSNPKKPSFWVGLRYKFARWVTKHKK